MCELPELVRPEDVDKIFRWCPGTAERLARRGRLPGYRLPDGRIRFALPEIIPLVERLAVKPVSAPRLKQKEGGE